MRKLLLMPLALALGLATGYADHENDHAKEIDILEVWVVRPCLEITVTLGILQNYETSGDRNNLFQADTEESRQLVVAVVESQAAESTKLLRDTLYKRLTQHHNAGPGEAHNYYRELLSFCLKLADETTSKHAK